MIQKKLKLYCGLLLAAIVIFAVGQIFNVNVRETPPDLTSPDEEMTIGEVPAEFIHQDTVNGRVLHNSEISITVDVVKKSNNQHVIVSHAKGETLKVEIKKAKLSVPTTGTNLKCTLLASGIGFALIYMGVILWIAWMAIKLVRRIRRGEIFETQLAKGLETTGILLVCIYILQIVAGYTVVAIIKSHVALAHYAIVAPDLGEFDYMLVIMGLTLMVISQIILIGKDMKEEQDLTI